MSEYPPNPEMTPELSPYEELEESYEQLQREFVKFQEETKRVQSRMRENHEQQLSRAQEDAAIEFFPVLDDLELAWYSMWKASSPADIGDMKTLEGISLIHKKFMDVLAKIGVYPIQESGVSFSPELHDAIKAESKDAVRANIVLQVHQKGYRTKERILRPAKVTVSK